jgi:hypothetical protein
LREVPSVVLHVRDLNNQLLVIVQVDADGGWERRFVVPLEIGLSHEAVSRLDRARSNTFGTYILERTPVEAAPVGVPLAHVLDMVALLGASSANEAAEVSDTSWITGTVAACFNGRDGQRKRCNGGRELDHVCEDNGAEKLGRLKLMIVVHGELWT